MERRVSIIVPCYNQAVFLPETLDSVLAQTYQNWECIIVNDGSPDNTDEVAKMYCEKDNRFKYLYKQNGGLSSARNAGLEVLTGEFVKFLDSDDLLYPNSLKKSTKAFSDDNTLDVVYTDYEYFSEKKQSLIKRTIGIKLKKNVLKHFICGWDITVSIPIHCILMKTKVITDNELKFDALLPAKEDWNFHISVAKHARNLKFIDSTEAVYRLCDNSMSRNVGKMTLGEYLVIKDHVTGKEAGLFYWKWSLILCESFLNIIKGNTPNPSSILTVLSKESSCSIKNRIILYGWLLLPFAFVSRLLSTLLNKTVRKGR